MACKLHLSWSTGAFKRTSQCSIRKLFELFVFIQKTAGVCFANQFFILYYYISDKTIVYACAISTRHKIFVGWQDMHLPSKTLTEQTDMLYFESSFVKNQIFYFFSTNNFNLFTACIYFTAHFPCTALITWLLSWRM